MKIAVLGVLGVVVMVSNSNANAAPLNVNEWKSAVEILKDARGKVEKSWAQEPPPHDEKSPWVYCAATAMEESYIELKKSMVEFDYAKLALNKAIDAPAAIPTSADDPLSVPYWGRYYMYWNDAPGRTQQDVIKAFDRSIEYAQNQVEISTKSNLSGDNLEKFDKITIQKLGLSKK